MGKLIIVTAPSGAGKTTIVRHLLGKYPELAFSVSATTRARRENEVDGKDYYFTTPEKFKELIADEAFLEWEEVYTDQFYGTLKSEIERIVATGKKVIFDIEVNGATSLKETYGNRCLVIFVKPPSFRILVQRLVDRKSESADSLRERIKRIKKELLFEQSFDMVLLNDELEVTLDEAEKIIAATVKAVEEGEIQLQPEEEDELVSASAIPAYVGIIAGDEQESAQEEGADKFSEAERRLREELAAFKLK